MGSVKIQIVESNTNLRSLLGWHLQQQGHWVQQSGTAEQARRIFTQYQPTLVILDSDLRDCDSLEFCHWLHQQRQCLILMLSADSTEKKVVAGLKAGADDYLGKPFGMQEFMARVESLIRRLRLTSAPLSLNYNSLRIDLVQRRVHFKGEHIVTLKGGTRLKLARGRKEQLQKALIR